MPARSCEAKPRCKPNGPQRACASIGSDVLAKTAAISCRMRPLAFMRLAQRPAFLAGVVHGIHQQQLPQIVEALEFRGGKSARQHRRPCLGARIGIAFGDEPFCQHAVDEGLHLLCDGRHIAAGRGCEGAADLLNRSVGLEAEPDLRRAAVEVVVDAVLIVGEHHFTIKLLADQQRHRGGEGHDLLSTQFNFQKLNFKHRTLAQAAGCATMRLAPNAGSQLAPNALKVMMVRVSWMPGSTCTFSLMKWPMSVSLST